jgi:hypothetical protein
MTFKILFRASRFPLENLKERDYYEARFRREYNIKNLLENWDNVFGFDSPGTGYGPVAGSSEYGN